ncbi:hypothetical protein TrST_g6782 [Triparma strigata]|uniref:Uncharacterized protein n=1 Tax=Triparma strigata TaxID=1606541 RepID=A0A9W7EWX7_9STRA|nr:hypothetical protein TrST_g6782 [Triparma strigata]
MNCRLRSDSALLAIFLALLNLSLTFTSYHADGFLLPPQLHTRRSIRRSTALPLKRTNDMLADKEGPLEGPLVFDWTNFSRPENYILFTQSRPSMEESTETVRVDLTKPITWLGILFFVPVFSSEFFFAISRSFICDLPQFPNLCLNMNGI